MQGKVTGSFQSGYLADVTVNGFTYQGVLFSPYLALNTPPPTYAQTVPPTRAPAGCSTEDAPGLPEGSSGLDPSEHSKLQQTKAEDGVPQAPTSAETGAGADFHMAAAAPSGPDIGV